MKFVCDRCNTRYSISDEKVRGKVLKIRCKTCGAVVTVNGEHLDAPPPPDPDRTVLAPMPIPESAFREPAEPPPPPAERTVLAPMPVPQEAIPTPAPRVPAREWHVSVDGKTRGPYDLDRMIEEVAGLSSSAEVHLWNEEMDGWRPVAQVSGVWRLVQHKRRVLAMPAKPSRHAAPASRSVPPPIPGAKRGDAPRSAARKRSLTPGNEGLLKPVSGVIAGSDAAPEDTPGPLPAGGPKVVPAPELVTAPARRVSAARPVATPEDEQGPPTPLPTLRPTPGTFSRTTVPRPVVVGTAAVPPPDSLSAQSAAAAPAFQAVPAAADAPVVVTPDVTPHLPAQGEPRLGDGGSALLPRSRLELVRRQRMLKYVIALLLVVVVVCVGVAWHAIQRGGQVRTVVIEKAAEKKLSPDELAEKLGMAAQDSPRPSNTVNVGRQQPPRPAASKLPVRPKPAQSAVDEQAAQRFAQPEALRLPPGGLSSGVRTGSTVPQEDITRVVNANKGGIKACYQRALLRDKSLTSGKITVRLSVGISGRVKSVAISGPPEFRSLEPCIKDVVLRWAFPASSDEYGTEFPFLFQGVE